MNAGFQRLLSLAQKTGDRIIIYDRYSDEHQVVMSLEEYESLLGIDDYDVDEDFDINDLYEAADMWGGGHGPSFERPTAQAPSFVPEQTPMVTPEVDEWHAAGDILDTLHPNMDAEPVETQADGWVDFFSEGDDEIFFEEPAETQKPEISYDPVMQTPGPGPILQVNHDIEASQTPEEPLVDEEPIFFEEPVE